MQCICKHYELLCSFGSPPFLNLRLLQNKATPTCNPLSHACVYLNIVNRPKSHFRLRYCLNIDMIKICNLLHEKIPLLSVVPDYISVCVYCSSCVSLAFLCVAAVEHSRQKKQSVGLLGDRVPSGLSLGDICCSLPPLCNSGSPTYLPSSLSATNQSPSLLELVYITQSRCV